jgi:hypothetical protein
MSKLIVPLAAAAIALTVPLAFAMDEKETLHRDRNESLIVAQQTSPDVPDPSGKDMEEQMQKMQEHMKEMQAQMEKIRQTTDPKERQRLMQEHMQGMGEQMQMMQGMGGCMMMRGMMGGRQQSTATPGKKGGMDCPMMKGGDPGRGQEMMEQRMDMMQMMMEQMLQHQEEAQAKPK